jgi:ubiquinone/menaquinone biosynthesis C-methylase UbiE
LNPYDRLYSQFNMREWPFGYPKYYMMWRWDHIKPRLAAYVQQPGRVLDLGGGTGVSFYYLPSFIRRSQYINLDYSSEMLQYWDGNRVQGIGETLPFESDTFDCVICSEVLEHVTNKQYVLEEATRVLRAGGLLLLSTPRTGWWEDVMANPWTRLLIHLHDSKPGKAFRRVFRSTRINVRRTSGVVDEPSGEKWLAEQIEAAGCQVIEQCRADPHLGHRFIGKLWRWIFDRMLDPDRFGHVTIVVAQKRAQ